MAGGSGEEAQPGAYSTREEQRRVSTNPDFSDLEGRTNAIPVVNALYENGIGDSTDVERQIASDYDGVEQRDVTPKAIPLDDGELEVFAYNFEEPLENGGGPLNEPEARRSIMVAAKENGEWQRPTEETVEFYSVRSRRRVDLPDGDVEELLNEHVTAFDYELPDTGRP